MAKSDSISPVAFAMLTPSLGQGCRAGYLFGGLMLNKHIRPEAVALSTLHEVVHAVLRSGEI
jgi:hypothetical protein